MATNPPRAWRNILRSSLLPSCVVRSVANCFPFTSVVYVHLQPKVATLRVEKSARSRTNTLIINSPPLTYVKIRYIIHCLFWDLDSNMVLVRTSLLGAALLGLAGCVGGTQTSGQSDGIFDPFETTNRRIHEFNRTIDKAILSPASEVYGIVPEELRLLLDNAATNLTEPTNFVNHVLQADPESAGVVLLRFAINSTVGIAGLGDPASEIGLFDRGTDFGETLAAWGLPEGAYIELPLLGASTVRNTVGIVVDFAIDPLNYVITEEQAYYLFALRGLSIVGTRLEYADLINTLLYESADSYAAQRLAYLQNKRRAVAGETVVEDLDDPFAE